MILRIRGDRALAALKRIDDGTLWYQFTELHAQRGESGLALDALDRAIAARDTGLVGLPSDPFLDPIRGEPRFKAAYARLKFPSAKGRATRRGVASAAADFPG